MHTHSPSPSIFSLAKILHWSLCLQTYGRDGFWFRVWNHLDISFTHSLILFFFFFFCSARLSLFIETTSGHLSLSKTKAQPLEMCKMQLSLNCDFCLSNLSFSNTFSDASPLKVNVPTQPHGHKAHGRIDVCSRSPPGSFERRAPRDLSV